MLKINTLKNLITLSCLVVIAGASLLYISPKISAQTAEICAKDTIAIAAGEGVSEKEYRACLAGHKAAGEGKTISEACGSYRNAGADNELKFCELGHKLNDKQVEQIDKSCAKDSISDETGKNATDKDVAACKEGYKGAVDKKTKSQVCDPYKDEGGSHEKLSCEFGYDKQVALLNPDDNKNADCQSGGFGLGWIICPIIEATASASDFIFSKLIEPMMDSVPISSRSSDPGYKTWQGFRFIANILLIGALLLMVMAQALGRSNIIDAYAMRKMAPRILIGVIAINLSIYFTVAMADIINIVGKGIGSLLTQPFIGAGNFDFDLMSGTGFESIAEVLAVNGVAIAGAVSLATTIIAFVSAEGATGVLGFFIFGILVPILLIALAILATLAIRQGLLVFLIIVSPIAFALYVLPGTEKYFRKWWELFVKTLLVYPIIAVIFAMSDILSVTSVNSTPSYIVNVILALIFTFLPLVLIPFAFKFAGGAMAAIFNAAQGVGGRMQKDGGWLSRRQQHYKQQIGDRVAKGRAEGYRKYEAMEGDPTKRAWRRRVAQYQKNKFSGYDGKAELREAEVNKRIAEERELQTNFGNDSKLRAYGIDMDMAKQQMSQGSFIKQEGEKRYRYSGQEGGLNLMREELKNVNGEDRVVGRGYRSLGGSYQGEGAVTAAERDWGKGNLGRLQSTTTYEMRKAIEEGQTDGLVKQYQMLANEWGMTQGEAVGTWVGPAFNNQDDLSLKHTAPTMKDGKIVMGTNHEKYMSEMVNMKSAAAIAQMKPHAVKVLNEGIDAPDAENRKDSYLSLADTLEGTMQQMRSRGLSEEQIAQQLEALSGEQGSSTASLYGSANTAKNINEYIKKVRDKWGRNGGAPPGGPPPSGLPPIISGPSGNITPGGVIIPSGTRSVTPQPPGSHAQTIPMPGNLPLVTPARNKPQTSTSTVAPKEVLDKIPDVKDEKAYRSWVDSTFTDWTDTSKVPELKGYMQRELQWMAERGKALPSGSKYPGSVAGVLGNASSPAFESLRFVVSKHEGRNITRDELRSRKFSDVAKILGMNPTNIVPNYHDIFSE